jgi:transposase
MAGTELTSQEQEKADILILAIEGKLTNDQAARQLRLSVRQVKRAKAIMRRAGISSVVHGLKGRPSNHRYPEEQKAIVVEKIKENYPDFKPKFATEKLQETEDIPMTSQTIRVWMTEAKLWKPRKQKPARYFSWRPRKDYYGELQQFDGSYHYWFENRYCDNQGDPFEVCLLASIDDATGEITKAVFAQHEGVIPVMTFWREYVETNGKPLAIYLDKFSTYKINHKAAVDNSELKTQFERAMQTLGIEMIFANSPQAKGRIERLFQTLQDRLVKELRMARINTPKEGNRFLKEVFLPKFNQQFAIPPRKEGNVHRSLLQGEKETISHIFSIHQTRRINNDFTIQFKSIWYQLTEIQPTTVRPQAVVLVETWLDDSVHILLKGQELNYLPLPEKPKKQRIKQPIILTTHTLNYKPPVNHPWRKYAKANDSRG